MKHLILFFLLLAGFAVNSFGQASATATSSGTIITPISISKTVDMNFGNAAVNSVAGTVVLTPAGTRTKTGGVTLPASAGTVTAASFTVSGLANSTYVITLPATPVTLTYNVTNTMTASSFTSSPTPTGTIGVGGSQTLTVGATLNVGASQVAGTYVSAGFTVTVNYN